jgi:hypothetical protein
VAQSLRPVAESLCHIPTRIRKYGETVIPKTRDSPGRGHSSSLGDETNVRSGLDRAGPEPGWKDPEVAKPRPKWG